MGRWIFIALCVILFAAGTYWLLQHEGIKSCSKVGGYWNYSRWACDME